MPRPTMFSPVKKEWLVTFSTIGMNACGIGLNCRVLVMLRKIDSRKSLPVSLPNMASRTRSGRTLKTTPSSNGIGNLNGLSLIDTAGIIQ